VLFANPLDDLSELLGSVAGAHETERLRPAPPLAWGTFRGVAPVQLHLGAERDHRSPHGSGHRLDGETPGRIGTGRERLEVSVRPSSLFVLLYDRGTCSAHLDVPERRRRSCIGRRGPCCSNTRAEEYESSRPATKPGGRNPPRRQVPSHGCSALDRVEGGR
jgi:hypothetical protein